MSFVSRVHNREESVELPYRPSKMTASSPLAATRCVNQTRFSLHCAASQKLEIISSRDRDSKTWRTDRSLGGRVEGRRSLRTTRKQPKTVKDWSKQNAIKDRRGKGRLEQWKLKTKVKASSSSSLSLLPCRLNETYWTRRVGVSIAASRSIRVNSDTFSPNRFTIIY